MDQQQLLSLYRSMLTAREIDKVEKELTNRGDAFFHLSGAGHEATAALASHLTADDWLHCHYRDRALLVARGINVRTFFDTLLCTDDSPGRGRRMSAFMNDPALNILSMVTPTGNNALQAVGVAAAVRNNPNKPIVYCGIGDGTTQQGEVLEAIGEAVRDELPVLFVIQDNKWAISTTTDGKTFYSLPDGEADSFYGIDIHYVNGRDPLECHEQFGEVVADVRTSRKPAIIVCSVERLTSHTNADDHTIYRTEEDIRNACETGDPILVMEAKLRQAGITDEDLKLIRTQVADQVAAAEEDALASDTPAAKLDAKSLLPVEVTHPSREKFGSGEGDQLNMKDALRKVLENHLESDPGVTLLGEDIEDPKGDVFGVTRGLSTEFPNQVFNSALSESTIVGKSIGRALTGERPVAFIQFADFMPTAYNQIVSELGAIHWRTDGSWKAPVILMIACGAFRPGLGPYHAQTFESVFAHCPGIDVFMPSTAADAAGMLNAAFESDRPTVFLYPKSCLNDSEHKTSDDVHEQFVPIGVAKKVQSGRDITLVGWGNTVSLCENAANALSDVGVEAEVIDLRSISPWDEKLVVSSAETTARLVVVHEDNQTCGMGAEILATVAERANVPVAMRRVAREDTFIPCNFENQIAILPSYEKVLTACADLLDMDLDWIPPTELADGVVIIEAIGSGPADESVEIVEIHVEDGGIVAKGDVIATVEATKSVFDITSSVDGTVDEILGEVGESIAVGAPLVVLSVESTTRRKKPVTQENPGTAVLSQRKSGHTISLARPTEERRPFDVGISHISSICGNEAISNDRLLEGRHKMTSDDIVRRTGIRQRYWMDETQTPLQMAVDSCASLLENEQLLIDDIDLLICSTTSPETITPSMSCRILSELTGGQDTMLQAYDISAACSGYLYALQAGYDFLQSKPDGRVLVTTVEVLSPLLDLDDFDTSVLFGDATTATMLYGEAYFDKSVARLHRPELSARGEDGSTLSVPLMNNGSIKMKGKQVFQKAVRAMMSSLTRVCQHKGILIDQLDLVVPHQANQRIIDAIQRRINTEVFSNIAQHGNTSSSSIPLCLESVLPESEAGERLGLCAFGGGFTFGAGIIEKL